MLEELKELDNWVCFSGKIKADGKMDKVPIDASTGRYAKCNDPNTWHTYEEAKAAVERHGYKGVGFQLNGNGIMAIDLDHCIKDGKLTEFAENVVNELDTYTEVSPSGEGLHLFIKTNVSISKKTDLIEIYTQDRYMTVTENVFGETKPVREINLKDLKNKKMFNRWFSKNPPFKDVVTDINNSEESSQTTDDDKTVLKKMFNSKNGTKIRALFNGDISEYDNDQSKADLALVNHLKHWCKDDAEQVDRLFRQSGLMRDKWDEHRGSLTYGEMTIKKAFGTSSSPSVELLRTLPMVKPEDFIKNGNFDSNILNFRQFQDRGTGFSNLDNAIELPTA